MVKATLQVESLSDIANTFNTQLHQLTPYYLITGYYPGHSLTVAAALFCVSGTFWAMTSYKESHPRSENHEELLLLFSSMTSFAGCVSFTVLVCTGLFKIMGGTFRVSKATAKNQADWLIDVILKGTLDVIIRRCWGGNSLKLTAYVCGIILLLGGLTNYVSCWALLTWAAEVWALYLLHWKVMHPDRKITVQ